MVESNLKLPTYTEAEVAQVLKDQSIEEFTYPWLSQADAFICASMSGDIRKYALSGCQSTG